MIADNNSTAFVSKLLESGVRLDGRQLFQSRKINVQFLDKPGHVLYSQGKTQVLVKTNPQIVMPKAQRPAEGFILFRVNCMVCPHSFDENKKNSNELVKLLQKVIISSNSLDPESLCILTGKFVWQIIVDCIIVRDDGNIVDAVLNSAMLALMDMKKPLVTVQKNQTVLGQKQLPLSIAHTPLSFTFGLVENCIFIDPSFEQEKCSQTRVTVSMNIYNEVCSIHKPGGKGITENVMSGIIKVGQKNIRELTNKLRELVQIRKNIRQCFDM